MTTPKCNRLVYLWLSLVLLCLCLLGCGSQEGPKEAAKEKAPPAAALPAPPPVGATTPKTADEYIRQGKEFFTAAQYDQAITAFSEALNLIPNRSRPIITGGLLIVISRILTRPSVISAAPSISTPNLAKPTITAPWLT